MSHVVVLMGCRGILVCAFNKALLEMVNVARGSRLMSICSIGLAMTHFSSYLLVEVRLTFIINSCVTIEIAEEE